MTINNSQPNDKTKYKIKEWLLSTLIQKYDPDDLIRLSTEQKNIIG